MKKHLTLLSFTVILSTIIRAGEISPTSTTISNPKVGQAPSVNHFAASATPFYRISWRTVTVGGSTVNYLTSFAYSGAQFFTADNVYAATTYAEIQAKVAVLGINNLPVDPHAH